MKLNCIIASCPENEVVVMATFVCLKFFILCIVLHSGEGEKPVGQHPAWRGDATAAAEVHADRQHAVGRAEARNGAPHGAV